MTMTDYGNGGSERGMPGDVQPEDVERIVGQSGGVPLYATRSYKAIERAQAQERSDRTPAGPTDSEIAAELGCRCQPPSRYTGPWHDEACPLYELPDYGVFGPDD